MATGNLTERVRNAWAEMRENLGRSTLQSLGVMLGVASVLGGFSISDSMRQRSKELYIKMGGLDKLNVQPSAVVKDGSPTALQMANLGLRNADAEEGQTLNPKAVSGVAVQKFARARVRSPYADQERDIRGIGGDFLATDGYEVARGRDFTAEDYAAGSPVAILGTEPLDVFFPNGDAIGRTIRIGDVPVQVVGVLSERVFHFRKSNRNMFRRRNRIIAVPTSLVTRRFEGDQYRRATASRSASATSTRWRRSRRASPGCSRRTTASRRTSAWTTSRRACARSAARATSTTSSSCSPACCR